MLNSPLMENVLDDTMEHKVMLEKELEATNIQNLLELFGPAFATRKRFWKGAFAAVVMGVLLGGVALCFFNFFEYMSSVLWLTSVYKEAIKQNNFTYSSSYFNEEWGTLDSGWLYVIMGALGGLAVGFVKLLWSKCIHTFPTTPPSLFLELKDLQCHDPSVAIPVLLCSAIGLGCGASTGPEAALGAVGAALGTLFSKFKWFNSRMQTMKHVGLFSIIGMSASFGPLLPSPILAVMLLHELGFASLERASEKSLNGVTFMEMVTLSGIAASVSFAVFSQIKDLTFLEPVNIPPGEIAVREPWTKYLGVAIAIGFASGIIGLIGLLFLGIGKKLGSFVNKWLAYLGLYFGVGINLGTLLTPVVGGTFYGLIAKAFPMSLGDGNAQLGIVVRNVFVTTYSPYYLLTLGLVKLLTLGISLGFGFIGGQIFPMCFAGACVGAAVTQLTGLNFLVSIPCFLCAVPCAFTPCIFTLVGLVSVMLALGGAATGPPFVAAIVSYTTVAGVGCIQKIMQRQLQKLSTSRSDDSSNQDDLIAEETKAGIGGDSDP